MKNTFDAECIEEASSGDEDELLDLDEMFSEESPPLDDVDKYVALREPLYTPTGADPSLSNATGGLMPTTALGSVKLPFNRRKIRYFDVPTAAECSVARSYLEKEMQMSKKRSSILLSRSVRRAQREERRRKRLDKGEATEEGSDIEIETPEERELLERGISRLDAPMTPAMAGALLLESLSINKVESLEGMSKCYDGIVAAGL